MPDYIVHKAVEVSALSKARQEDSTRYDWVLSPKYDGCHAVLLFDQGKHVNTLARSGESVRSMPHIAQSLLDNYPLGNQRVAVCGEAWMLGAEFNIISGAFRRHAPQPQLGFVPFDVVPFDYNDEVTTGPTVLLGQADHKPYLRPYIDRLATLTSMLGSVPHMIQRPRWVSLFDMSLQDALVAASNYALEHKARTDNFFDGAVLARAGGQYIVGSGKGGEFIKVKPLISETVTCTGYFSGVGAKTGKTTGGLLFVHNEVEQRVATGLSQAQVEDLPQFVGKRIEVEAMGLTLGRFFREPRFKGIRNDA